MPEDQARDLIRRHGLEPLEPYVNSITPWLCRHTCGKEVRPRLTNASRGFGICRYCDSTFPYDGPAQVYLAADFNALKIGISSRSRTRISQHTTLGWHLKWRMWVPTGDDAYALEQAAIRWWRYTLCATSAYTKSHMPQWGSTETVSWGSVTPHEVLDFVTQLATEWGLEYRSFPAFDVDDRPQREASTHRSTRGRRTRGTRSDLALF